MNDAQPGRVITPHIEWARPWAPGSLRVFFLTPGYVAPAEINELWERLDITYEAVVGRSHYLPYDLNEQATDQWNRIVIGTNPGEKLQELKDKLAREYDIYCFAGFEWTAVPSWVRALVLRKVSEEGKGLVVTYQRQNQGLGMGPGEQRIFPATDPEGMEYMTRGTPFHGLPYFSAPISQYGSSSKSWWDGMARMYEEKPEGPANTPKRIAANVKVYRAGAGRVVWIGWQYSSSTYYGHHAFSPLVTLGDELDSDIHYEYYLSLAARAFSWVAPEGKGVPLRLQSDPLPDGASFENAEAVALKPAFAAQPLAEEAKVEGTVTVQWTLRDAAGTPEQAGQGTWVNWQQAEYLPTLKPVGAGQHFFDWILRDRRGVVNWGSVAFTVMGTTRISTLQLSKQSFEPGEQVTGRVLLGQGCAAGSKLMASLTDTFGREIARSAVPLAAGAVEGQFALQPRGAVAQAGKVTVRIEDAKGVQATATAAVYTPVRKRPSFIYCLWTGGWYNVIGRRIGEQVRQAGMNVLNDTSWSRGAFNNFLLMPTNVMHLPGQPIDNVPYSLADPVWREKSVAKLRDQVAAWSPYNFLGYSFGDEMTYLPTLEDKASLANFAQRLERKYRTLAELNAAWGSEFGTWEEAAKPISPAEALRTKQYAHYEDWAAHGEALYAEIQQEYARTIRDLQPTAVIGAEGSVGGDLELTTADLDFWGPYYNRTDNAILAAIRREREKPLYWGNWWGAYTFYWGTGVWRSPTTVPYLVWNFTLDGCNTLLSFTSEGSEGIRHVGGGFAEHYQWAEADLKQLSNGGIWQLLAHSEANSRGTYLLYSPQSQHASALWGGVGNHKQSLETQFLILDEIALNASALTERQLVAGALNRAANVKVLFLPGLRAVSEAALDQIESFVSAGGTVVADVQPLQFDELLRPRTDGRAEALFGIARSESPAVGKGTVADLVVNGDFGGRKVSLQLPKATVDAEVKVTTGTALGHAGETPAVVVNNFGRGKAVLLNFSLEDYRTLRAMQTGVENPMKEFMAALLAGAGVTPIARVDRPDGQRLELLRCASFLREGTTVLGLLRRPVALDGTGPGTLRLEAAAHVYDTLTGKYYGKVDSIPVNLAAGQRMLLALTDQRVTGVKVTVPARVTAGQDAEIQGEVQVEAGRPGSHTLRLEVVGPEGREREALRQVKEAPAGRATFAVPYALNDLEGRWEIRVSDVATAVQGQAAVELTGGVGAAGVLPGAIGYSTSRPQVSPEAAAFPVQRDWSQEQASVYRFRDVLFDFPRGQGPFGFRQVRLFDWVRLYGLGLQYYGFLDLPDGAEPVMPPGYRYAESNGHKYLRSYEEVPMRARELPLGPGKGAFDSFAVQAWSRNDSIPGAEQNAWGHGMSMNGRGFLWKYYVPGLDREPRPGGWEQDEVMWGQAYQRCDLWRREPEGLAEFVWDYRREDDAAAPHGKLSARFLKGPQDGFGMARFQAIPDEDSPAPTGLVKLTVKLSAVAASGPPTRERWLKTAARDVRAAETMALDQEKEWALALYNRGAQESGGTLLVVAPGDVQSLTTKLENDCLLVEMVPAQQFGAVRLAFWEFSQERPEVALERFFERAAGIRRRLEGADWTANLTQYFDLAAYQGRVGPLAGGQAYAPGFGERYDAAVAEAAAALEACQAAQGNLNRRVVAEWRYAVAARAAQTLEKEVSEAWIKALRRP